MVLEKTLESPLDCKEIQPVHKGDQSWVFIGRTDVEAETPILWPNIWGRADSFEKTLMLGKIDSRKRRGRQSIRWLDGIIDSMDMSLGKLGSWWWKGRSAMLQYMGSQRVRHDWSTEPNWIEPRYHWMMFSRGCIELNSARIQFLMILQLYHLPPPLPTPNSNC